MNTTTYMSTKLYKKVHSLATEMLLAADEEDDQRFNTHYEELKTLCGEYEDKAENHPVQWETLADFTEDLTEAMAIYEKALSFAQSINANDYIASISYAMALLFKEQDEKEHAVNSALQAGKYAAKTEDQQLQREIKQLLKSLPEKVSE